MMTEVRCDTGSPLSVLRDRFASAGAVVDFSELRDGWEVKEGDYKDTGDCLRNRLQRFTGWLLERPEQRIAVIAHHNMLAALLGVTFLNGEVRRYSLSSDGVWSPVVPLVSACDEELTAQDKAHLKVYDPLVRRKFQGWFRVDAPERLR